MPQILQGEPLLREIQKCRDGYFLENRLIRTKSSKLESQQIPKSIHRIFANTVTDDGSALKFVQKYGFVSVSAGEQKEKVWAITSFSKILRGMIEVMEREKAKRRGNWTDKQKKMRDAFSDHFEAFEVSPRLNVRFGSDAAGNSRVIAEPLTLADYMGLLLANEICGNLRPKICEGCGKEFMVPWDDKKQRARKVCPNTQKSCQNKIAYNSRKNRKPKRKK